jgi:hypothetical protein
MKDEKFYDEEIAPVLLELANKCKARNMPFIAAVQYDFGTPNEGVAKTLMNVTIASEIARGDVEYDIDEGMGADMKLSYLAMLAQGNLDRLVLNVARMVGSNHDSMVLSMIGRGRE